MTLRVQDAPREDAERADVRAARGGDAAAFERLVRRFQRPLFGLAVRLLNNDAEASEVTQEAFLRAFQHLGRYDDARPFELWLMAIARNLSLDLLRRRSRVSMQELEPLQAVLPSENASAEAAAIAREERQGLEAAMRTLSAEDREVLGLYYVQRRTTKEIAQLMGVAPGTIMARLFRARVKLRQQIKPEDAP